ncbi:YlqD family protein [Peribacillus kribbensis]|uniref:YlqD family protein n=1 Tax=Peribacillus kribbensis TaxID=356658 RepID=UPI00040B64E4|nr:YlqD family protein [Peribacillus kribbensis]
MEILQTVIVKHVLTETSKNQLLEKYEHNKGQLLKECGQLRFELKKMEKMKKMHPGSLKVHFEKEINKRQEKIKMLDFQIDQLGLLPLGSELKDRELQAIVKVEVGQVWDEAIGTKTIVVKDGMITEIR